MIGSEMTRQRDHFHALQSHLLLTLSKRYFNSDRQKSVPLRSFQHLFSAGVVTSSHRVLHILLMLRNRFETTRIAIDNRRQKQPDDDGCQLARNIMINNPMIDAPSRTTVISAPDEEEGNLF